MNRRSNQPLSPPRRGRIVHSRLLIVCEGEKTEPTYFRSLWSEHRNNSNLVAKIKQGSGGSAIETVDLAIRIQKEAVDSGNDCYDEIWCVIDVEAGFSNSKIASALTIAARENKKNNLKFQIVLSNPCFECWYLAHFEPTSRSFNHCDDVQVQLNKHWKKAFGADYSKNDKDHYEKLKDKLTTAKANSKIVDENFPDGTDQISKNSSTEVYQLIERLLPSL